VSTRPAVRFTVLDQGTIYRTTDGPQGYYSRVVRLGDREFLASFVASGAIESPDSHPELTRSTDGGATWTGEGPVDPGAVSAGRTTETGFISMGPHGSLFCLGSRWAIDPADPTRPLIHPRTVGMRANEVILRRSADRGRTWTPPETLPKPYPVPLELPTGVVGLVDGTLILSCSTWREWDGDCPYGHRVTTMRSADGGRTWSEPIDIFHDTENRIGFWEARIAQLSGDLLLATCWAHDWQADQDLPNHFALSHDGGRMWGPPAASPAPGQTGWPLSLGDGRILFVYNHRKPPVGLRAQVADVARGQWTTVYDGEVWSPEDRRTGSITRDDYAVTHFQFGAPSALRLSGDASLVVYWCVVKRLLRLVSD
jgi:hypothetical protein